MRLFVLAAAAAIVLAGCQTRDERQTAQCSNYGFQPGTQQFAQCKMTVDTNERQAFQQQQMQNDAIQAQQQLQNSRPVPGSLLAGPQNTSCGYELGRMVCRPTW